jgi:hypothetical protein
MLARFYSQALVEAPSPPSDWAWMLVKCFLARWPEADVCAVPVPIALARKSPRVAKRILRIITNCFDESAAVISPEIHAHFLEFFRRRSPFLIKSKSSRCSPLAWASRCPHVPL